MASAARQCKSFRQWNKLDSLDPADVCHLYSTEKLNFKSGRSWRNYFSVYFVLIGFISLFLFGILVGFYVRENQNVPGTCDQKQKRKDGLDHEKLQSVHQNIMYYLSQKRIDQYTRKLEEHHRAAAKTANFYEDPQSVDFIAGEFRKFGLDSVKVEDHSVVVTYPDPTKPNRLEFLTGNGTVIKTITGGRQVVSEEKRNNASKIAERLPPFAVFSPSGIAEGKLVYAHYGQYMDYLSLLHSNVSVQNSVVLVRHGEISIPRKVQLAEKFGASGVLLFYHPDDFADPDSQFMSVADFTDEEPYYPTIPVQTVSQSIAAQLLGNISTTSLLPPWLPSLKKLLMPGTRNKLKLSSNSSEENLRVRLTVNTISSTVIIKNVIGVIQGGTESDRYITIGARRPAPLSSSTSTSLTNTAILLELARSLTYIRSTEGWVPRRGIRLCSWGGVELSQFGVYSHIINNKENIEGSGVATIDLDLQDSANQLEVITSPGLLNLVRNVAHMVPDPGNGEQSVGDSWPEVNLIDLVQDNSSVISYNDVQHFPFLETLGISSIKMTSRENMTIGEARDKPGYLLSHSRVVSLILSQLADHQYLPISVEQYVNFTRLIVDRTADMLKQHLQGNLTDVVQKFVKEAEECSITMAPGWHKKWQCQNELVVRKINNILQKLDSHFLKKIPHLSTSYLLSPNRDNSVSQVITSAIEEYSLTGDTETFHHVLSVFVSSLQNFSTSVCQLKQILQNR